MRRWWFLFFVVSGFCSLLYEVVWLRLAMAQFGVTTALVSIVLSIFMAGLALGSWSAGVLTRRLAGAEAVVAMRLYAIAEVLTACSATAVPALLSWGRTMLVGIRAVGLGLRRSSLCVLVALLPFCTCMGATFPWPWLRCGRADPTSARQFSYLYVANVVGAALGTFLTGFVMIELLGFHGTLAAAAFLNASLAVMALLVSLHPRATVADAGAAAAPEGAPIASGARTSGGLLVGLF
jgi:spermidine synthase